MNKHLMIDLETMGNGPTSAIVAIGAKFFDVDLDGDIEDGPEYYTAVSLSDGLHMGMDVDGSTIEWWMGQCDEARASLFTKPVALETALNEFTKWVKEHRSRKLSVWSHATFDIPVLAYSYRATHMKLPWHYRETRDIRTLNYLAPDSEPIPREGVHHNALDDCKYQILYVTRMLREFI